MIDEDLCLKWVRRVTNFKRLYFVEYDGGRSYIADLRVYAGKIAHFCHSFTLGK